MPDKSIAIIGQRDCPLTSDVISKVLSILSQLSTQSVVSVRTPDGVSRTSPVEEFVWRVGNDFGLLVVAHAPEGDDERPGVLARNRRLIATSTDGLFAFFKEDSFMNGGTGMVVEAAYEQGRMVEAYSVRPDGSVEISGSAAGTRGFWSSSLSFSL